MSNLDIPVALFLFNRPELTRQVFFRIREARPAHLFLIADGPRPNHPTDGERCAAAREVVKQIDWPCQVERNFADANLGCKYRVSSGLEWVFDQVEAAIILEDDTVPEPTFFPFAQELLYRYWGDTRVMHISGRNQLGHIPQDPYSYFFSRLPNVWGWATWRRAWRIYDVEARSWTAEAMALIKGDPVESTLLPYHFREVQRGKIDTWDYQWVLQVMLNSGLTIVPTRNLVRNIGYGPDATHTAHGYHHPYAKMTSTPIFFPLNHPPHIHNNPMYDERLFSMLRRPPLAQRIRLRWVRFLYELGVGRGTD